MIGETLVGLGFYISISLYFVIKKEVRTHINQLVSNVFLIKF